MRLGFCIICVIMFCMYGFCIMFWIILGLLDICCMRDCMVGVWNMLFMGLFDCWVLVVWLLSLLKVND